MGHEPSYFESNLVVSVNKIAIDIDSRPRLRKRFPHEAIHPSTSIEVWNSGYIG